MSGRKEGVFSSIAGALLHKDKDKKSPRPDEKSPRDKKVGVSERSSDSGAPAPKISVTDVEQPFAKNIPLGMLRVFLPDDQSLLVVQQSDQTLAELFTAVQKKYPTLLRDPTVWEFRGGATPGVYAFAQWQTVLVGNRNQIALMKRVGVSPRPGSAAGSPIITPKSGSSLSTTPQQQHSHSHSSASPAPASVPSSAPGSVVLSPTPAPSGWKAAAAAGKSPSPSAIISHPIGNTPTAASTPLASTPSTPSPGPGRGSPKLAVSPPEAGRSSIRVRVGEHGAELDVYTREPNPLLSALLHQLELQLHQHTLSLPAPAKECEFRTPSGKPLRLAEMAPANASLLIFVPREVQVTLPDETIVRVPLDENTIVLQVVRALYQNESAREFGTEWELVSADNAEVLTMSSVMSTLLEICPRQRFFVWRKLPHRYVPAPGANWANTAERKHRTLVDTLAQSFAEDIVLSAGRACLPVELWAELTPVPEQQIKTQLLEWLADTLARLRFVASPQRSNELDTLKTSLTQIAEQLSSILSTRASSSSGRAPSSPGSNLAVPRGHNRTPSVGGPATIKEIQQRAITVPSYLAAVQNFVHASISFLEVYRPWSLVPQNGDEARRLFAEVLDLIDRSVVRGFVLEDINLHIQKYLRRSVEEIL